MKPGKTYMQLYWDKEFVQNRIQEQYEVLSDVQHNWAISEITLERAKELNDSATHVLRRFETQLENIKKLK
jgi:hypothetical protein